MSGNLRERLLVHYQTWSAQVEKEPSLKMHVLKHDRPLIRELVNNTGVLFSLPRPVHFAWRGKKWRGLSAQDLKKHSDKIAKAYLETNGLRTFQEFVSILCQMCANVAELDVQLKKLVEQCKS